MTETRYQRVAREQRERQMQRKAVRDAALKAQQQETKKRARLAREGRKERNHV